MSLNITGIPATVIPVRDHDAAIAFYVGKLGFEIVVDTPFGDGDRWVEVAPVNASHAIALGKPPAGSPIGVMTGIILESADIDADHRRMRELGVDVDDQVIRHGAPVPPMFWFRDADANILLLVQRDTAPANTA